MATTTRTSGVRAALLLMIGCANGASAGGPAAQLLPRDHIEFQPAVGQTLSIPFTLAKSGAVSVALYTADRDLVRTLKSNAPLAAGRHALNWDGRDDRGQLVPDEAYHPVLTCACGEAQNLVVDSRANTGGVVIERIPTTLGSDGTITFDLPQPARSLVRIGVKGGAMMRAIDAWRPRSAGRVRVEWDGYDASGVVRLPGQPGLTVLVTAFSLPDHSIITSGNGAVDYFAYRKDRRWGAPLASADPGPLQRNGKRVSRQASLPRSLLQDPRVSMTIVDKLSKTSSGAVKVSGPVTFRVDMPQEDKWLVQQSLYEVGFFLDHQFVSEEETGYTPLSWRWDPAGIAPGEHLMTVNISGFWGQVGVASIRLMIADK
ncbi:MAG: hypothetical protein ACREV5_13270 [Steroidobacter sp.]